MNAAHKPGTLHLSAAPANPHGTAGSQLYLFRGDATATPTLRIEPELTFQKSPGRLGFKNFHLRIYHFNDLHGHLMRFTPEGQEAVFSRFSGVIQPARRDFDPKADAGVLVLTAGDDCTGSIFDETMVDDALTPLHHPGYQLYSKLGVDAAGLGNHDMDRGLHFLAEAIKTDACFPILAANLRGCHKLSGACHPAAILVVKGIRVGLIGLVTRAENRLNPTEGQVVNPIPVALSLVKAIRPLCDLLIILSHLGYSLERGEVPMADAGDVELARKLPSGSVDLIIGGHSHSALNMNDLDPENIINGIPITQAGSQGHYLGQIDILLKDKSVAQTEAHLIPTKNLRADQVFEEREMVPIISQVTGLVKRSLGQVEGDPELSTETVLSGFGAGELALANFVTDALVERLAHRGLPVDLTMIDSSCLLRGLSVGRTLTFGDWFKVMPYADIIRLYKLTPQQLKELLNDNALRIDRPGEAHTERGFLQFSRKLRYHIHLGYTRFQAHAGEIMLEGLRLIKHDKRCITIATTNFTRELAASWESGSDVHADRLVNLHSFPHTETNIFLRQEMVSYILEHGGIHKKAGARRDGRLQVQNFNG